MIDEAEDTYLINGIGPIIMRSKPNTADISAHLPTLKLNEERIHRKYPKLNAVANCLQENVPGWNYNVLNHNVKQASKSVLERVKQIIKTGVAEFSIVNDAFVSVNLFYVPNRECAEYRKALNIASCYICGEPGDIAVLQGLSFVRKIHDKIGVDSIHFGEGLNCLYTSYLMNKLFNLGMFMAEGIGPIIEALDELVDGELIAFYSQADGYGLYHRLLEYFSYNSLWNLSQGLDSLSIRNSDLRKNHHNGIKSSYDARIKADELAEDMLILVKKAIEAKKEQTRTRKTG